MYQDKRIAVIIAAAGSGTRMGSGISKQYVRIGSEMVLEKSLKAFGEHPFIDDIYLVVKKEDMEFCRKEFTEEKKLPKIRAILSGGEHRQSSVYNGLRIIHGLEQRENKPCKRIFLPDFVLVHDGARPFISSDEISRLVSAVTKWGAATLGVPVKDTVARVENLWIKENLDRSLLYSIQTPQGFLFSKLLDAHKKARAERVIGTDDAGLVQRLGIHVALVPGEYSNVKITTMEDLRLMGAGIWAPGGASAVESLSTPKNPSDAESPSAPESAPAPESLPAFGDPLAPENSFALDWRIGTGYDVHALVPNRELVLGGVRIPWELGLQGHSDADVLTHVIMDALLGACGLGDIGERFPDSQPKYKNISSLALLAEVRAAMKAGSFEIGNIDAVVIAERPKIAPYIKEMKHNIANVLEIESAKINIKGTTTEGLGFCGRGEGIAAMASTAVYGRYRTRK